MVLRKLSSEALIRKRIGNRTVVASVSGGKDSAAMCLYLQELGIEHRRVFMDTGWEAAETYEYLRGPLTEKLGLVEEISAELQMVEQIRKKGMFPSRLRRWCTEYLKMRPLAIYLSEMDVEPISAMGVRAAESLARSRMSEWEWHNGMDVEMWRPLLRWSVEDVVAIHGRHGLRPNPLYLKGAKRVGCWPCIYARKAEIRFIAENDPERIALIRELEPEISKVIRAKIEGRDDTVNYVHPETGLVTSFFGASGKPVFPIDEAVAWSKTSRGGRQFELFAAGAAEAGCMRWGLCETNSENDES